MLTIVIPEIPRDALLTIGGMLSAAITFVGRAYLAYRRERDEREAKKETAHEGLTAKVIELVGTVAGAMATGTEVLRNNNDRLNEIEAALKIFRANGAETIPTKATA